MRAAFASLADAALTHSSRSDDNGEQDDARPHSAEAKANSVARAQSLKLWASYRKNRRRSSRQHQRSAWRGGRAMEQRFASDADYRQIYQRRIPDLELTNAASSFLKRTRVASQIVGQI